MCRHSENDIAVKVFNGLTENHLSKYQLRVLDVYDSEVFRIRGVRSRKASA